MEVLTSVHLAIGFPARPLERLETQDNELKIMHVLVSSVYIKKNYFFAQSTNSRERLRQFLADL